ncbi:hypothetical protein ULG90_11060 [Halopseudomonas pachastrellae]|nr:hypothetical protein ULG90_11060 [Halopseudomonas pachastrellae]
MALSAAMHVGEKVLRALAPAFMLQGRDFFVSASIGIAFYPQDGEQSSILLKNATPRCTMPRPRARLPFSSIRAT